MNLYMAASTKYAQILNIIDIVRWVNMMHIQPSFSLFAQKAFVAIKGKRPFTIYPRSFSKVRVLFITTLEFIKRDFLAFSRTKLRSVLFRKLVFKPLRTNFTNQRYFSIPFITRFLPARPTTKMNCTRLLFIDISRSSMELLKTVFALKANKFVTSFFVTKPGAKFCSVFFKRAVAYGTSLHTQILPLAMDKLQPAEVTNEGL